MVYADIDPDGANTVGRFEQAMVLKQQGDTTQAATLLVQSCIPPSIYHGHYRELFKIWRQMNREDLKLGNYQPVITRVTDMIRFDEEMISVMLEHWSFVQKRKLPKDYFQGYRNLLQTDAKALLQAGEATGDGSAAKAGKRALEQIMQRKGKV